MPTFATLLFLGSLSAAGACNYLQSVSGTNRTPVVGRDMQFTLGAKLFAETWTTYPVGRRFRALAPLLEPYQWEAKYGILGITFAWDKASGFVGPINEVLEELAVLTEGTNTVGLQCSTLYMADFSDYQKPDRASGRHHLEHVLLCSWALSLFANVKQVNSSLPELIVTDLSDVIAGLPGPALKNYPPLHWALTDQAGDSIVVEYVQGKLHTYNNVAGVMTNQPPFDWQLTNLQLQAPWVLTPTSAHSTPARGALELAMKGLPGDLSSSSRFVRLAVELHYAQQAHYIASAREAVTMMQHLLNIGDVVKGAETKGLSGWTTTETSLWSVVWDLQALRCWFRSYDSQVWQVLDMRQLDFTPGAASVIYSPYTKVEPTDVTADMRGIIV